MSDDTYECDNCGHVEADPPEAKDLAQRLDENGIYTDRECSVCGALTYKQDVLAEDAFGVEYQGDWVYLQHRGGDLVTLQDNGNGTAWLTVYESAEEDGKVAWSGIVKLRTP